jgi:hypothetical protein
MVHDCTDRLLVHAGRRACRIHPEDQVAAARLIRERRQMLRQPLFVRRQRRFPVQLVQLVLRRFKARLQQLKRFGYPGFHQDVFYSNKNLLQMRYLQQTAISHSIKPSPAFTPGVSLKTAISPLLDPGILGETEAMASGPSA